MKKAILILLIAGLALFSCDCGENCTDSNADKETTNTPTDTNTVATGSDVTFVLAKNYFVKNSVNVDETTVVKITTKNELDSLFGLATTMAEEGKPTEIDFEKQYAIAVIEPKTEMGDSLESVKLTQLNEMISVAANYKKGEKQTFTSNPFVLLFVDNTTKGEIQLTK